MLRRHCTALLLGVLGLLIVPVLATPATGATTATTATTTTTTTAGVAAASGRAVLRTLFEARVVTLTNRRRARAGCRPLRVDVHLRDAARAHSASMSRAGSMAHELPGELGVVQRIVRAGYTPWRRLAENVAAGFLTPGSVVRAWMASPGHRRNLLDCRLREIGVGVVAEGTQLWWTQDFGRR